MSIQAATVDLRRTVLRLSVPFREPFVTANGVIAARELFVVRLDDLETGLSGFGEAAPFEPYDGVPAERVAAELTGTGAGARRPRSPQTRAAGEMAWLDLEARRAERPVGEPGADVIPVNRTLAAGPPDEIAAAAAEGVRQGYACFKLKVGLPDDELRVRAVREAIGPWPALRVDANGAWPVDEALRRIDALAPYDLELVEQPCATIEELAAVRRRCEGVPVAADEVVASPQDVERAAAAEACDVVAIKVSTCGGYLGARETLRAARANGLDVYLSSTFDGPWGIAAGLRLAASEHVQRACGLATLELFDARLARALPAPRGGLMSVPAGPGLGVEADDAALAEVLVEELR